MQACSIAKECSTYAGGEQRRLSIACALIALQPLLFLDEPTTGLDSFAALNVMEHMSCLAAMGHTIVASIHQPRTAIWDMFHKVGFQNFGIDSPGYVKIGQDILTDTLLWFALHLRGLV